MKEFYTLKPFFLKSEILKHLVPLSLHANVRKTLIKRFKSSGRNYNQLHKQRFKKILFQIYIP